MVQSTARAPRMDRSRRMPTPVAPPPMTTTKGIEHMAREQYNLVFPGERVILIKSGDVVSEDGR